MLSITPMPVVVRSMTPEAVRTLPHIFISNWPNEAVERWTLYAAIIAGLIALLTLAAVGWQIWLARRALTLAREELEAANKTLKLASDELNLTGQALDATNSSNALVRESLEYAKKQSEYLLRRADLRLYADFTIGGTPPPRQAGNYDNVVPVTFFIANNGDNSARGASVQLLLPPGLLLAITREPMRGAWDELQDWNDGERQWKHYERRLNKTFFPRSVQSGFVALFVHAGTSESDVRWRLLYDDGITPTDMPFAPLRTMATLDRTNIMAGVPPPPF